MVICKFTFHFYQLFLSYSMIFSSKISFLIFVNISCKNEEHTF
jgi:hypothetical protein